jgi:deoxyribonuclease-4
MLAAGYNVATEDGLNETIELADQLFGMENVRVIHSNDSKGALGSHLDRHQNIGEGQIGLEGFRCVVNHPKLRDKAFILETPVDKPGDDRKNLETLKALRTKP